MWLRRDEYLTLTRAPAVEVMLAIRRILYAGILQRCARLPHPCVFRVRVGVGVKLRVRVRVRVRVRATSLH